MKKSASIEIGEEKTLSSGVTVRVLPFPAGLWDKINAQILEEYPDPIPPKKTITVLGGTEEVDDLDDPEYKEKAATTKKERDTASGNIIGEATLDLCVEVDLTPYTNIIKRLEKYSGKFPADSDERRVRFLAEYALRSRGDYEVVTFSAVTQMTIGDKEVAGRISNFQDNLAGPGAHDNGASGAPEIVGLEVVEPLPGTGSGA